MITRQRAVFFGLLLAPPVARAQPTRSIDDVRTAAVVAYRSLDRPARDMPIVADSAELWRRFVRCRGRAKSRHCALKGATKVTMFLVTLPTSDSAAVEVREYQMIAERCPSRTPIVPPRLGVAHVEYWAFRFRDGRWQSSGRPSTIAC